MNIELRHVRCFIAVAELLHFRKAAEKLNIAQPALTRTIHQLEDIVGVKLLERTTRKVTLTHAGQELLAGFVDVQSSLEQAIKRVEKSEAGEKGQLTIGYTDFAINDVLPSIVKAFRQTYPEVSVNLNHGFTTHQLKDVHNGSLDFGFVTGPIKRPYFDSVEVSLNDFVAIFPESHRFAKQDKIKLSDFVDEPFVMGTKEGWEHYHDHLYRLCRSEGFEPRVVQTAFNTEGIFGLIACGMGITIQLRCLENYIRKGLLVRDLQENWDPVPIIAIWDNRRVSPVKKRFIEFLRHYISLSQ